jgi:endonuclease/exonuclease/phosphatase family metal-dependent hydrolase
MKLSLFLSLLLFLITIGCNNQSYTAATYNIRMNTESDGINRWDNRKDWVKNQILELNLDVFGTQEGLPEQISFLDSTLIEYDYAGVGRRDGVSEGEHSAIFYKTDKFNLVEKGDFWLSETPEQVSKGWDAAVIRICTYTLLKNKESDDMFWVFNAHLDHIGATSRLEALKLIQKRADSLNTDNYPIVVMGDFNALPDSPPIQFLSEHFQDSRVISKTEPLGPVGTFNGFDTNHPLENRIDYVFVSDRISIGSYSVVNEIRDNRTPSDHLPVVIEFTL